MKSEKIYARILFEGNVDVDAIDEICDRYDETDYWYEEKYVKFHGYPERLQELIRELKTVETIKAVRNY